MKLPQNSIARNVIIVFLFGIGAVFFPLVIGFGITVFVFKRIKDIRYRIVVLILVFLLTLALSSVWTDAIHNASKTKELSPTPTDVSTAKQENQITVTTIPSSKTQTINPTIPTTNISPTVKTSASSANNCNQDLWSHVYNPSRLKILNPCLQVTGTISVIRVEKDGDDHVLLKLDTGQENLLNQENISQQKGDLVLEPVCLHKVTQEDAISSCNGFTSGVVVPGVGTHVTVVGSYVLDTAHGWNEIHPVSKILIQ